MKLLSIKLVISKKLQYIIAFPKKKVDAYIEKWNQNFIMDKNCNEKNFNVYIYIYMIEDFIQYLLTSIIIIIVY